MFKHHRGCHRAVCGAASLLLVSLQFAAAHADPPRVERGVSYGEVGGQSLRLDIYHPATAETDRARAAVVLVHGGGWAGGHREVPSIARLGDALARAGFVAFSIDYRLVRRASNGDGWLNQYPAAIDDCRRAVRWIRAHAEEYHIDPERIGACGESAGGHLASLLGTTDHDDGALADNVDDADKTLTRHSSRVRAVVNIFGPADLTQDFSQFRLTNVTVQDLVDNFLGEPKYRRDASPQFHIDDRSAAFLLVHGTEDRLVPVQQSRDFHAALEQAGRPSEYVEFEGEGHGFSPQVWNTLLAKTIAFFDQHLRAD